MDTQKIKQEIDTLAKLITDANKAPVAPPDSVGACRWTDSAGNARCNAGWTLLQCQSAGGLWTLGGGC
jgi:hypothetical protein